VSESESVSTYRRGEGDCPLCGFEPVTLSRAVFPPEPPDYPEETEWHIDCPDCWEMTPIAQPLDDEHWHDDPADCYDPAAEACAAFAAGPKSDRPPPVPVSPYAPSGAAARWRPPHRQQHHGPPYRAERRRQEREDRRAARRDRRRRRAGARP